jgi:hypothetical protein
MKLFEKSYDGRSLIDVDVDVLDSLNNSLNPLAKQIPLDEYFFYTGKFTVSVSWEPDWEPD